MRTLPDIPFAEVPGGALCLDLYLPEEAKRPPLVMVIHGGAWHKGSRKNCRLTWLADRGYALAAISYRLTDRAMFPAQIHDCKGAVRWLRAHADDYGYDASRIGVIGSSAGGHLALLLGVTAGNRDLEGAVGGHREQSSAVQAIVDFYGPTDFLLRRKTQPHKTDPADCPLALLLGGPVPKKEAVARLASPAFHVTTSAPPLLVFHGTADTTVLMDQSERIVSVYRELGVPVEFHVVEGAAHGGEEYHSPENRERVAGFLERCVRQA